jgi:UDP-glucose 4-epimerase
MNPKKALVTGALGHTGSFLIHALREQGWHVIATDLSPDTRNQVMTKESVFQIGDDRLSIDFPEVQFIPADLTDISSLEPLFAEENCGRDGYDVIFHPASLYDYFAPLTTLRQINVTGLQNLLESIVGYVNRTKSRYPHFIHWSTCGVYGQPNYILTKDEYILPTDESAPYNPPNNYSISKMEQEQKLIEFAQKFQIPYTILRAAPIYGPYQTYGMFHIYYMSYLIGSMPLPHILPRQKALMMPMVHVVDLVRAAIFLANRPAAFGQAYNIVADTTTQEEWLEFIFQELGVNYTIIPIPWGMYKIFARVFEWWGTKQEKRARRMNVRPKIDLPMTSYVIHQYYFSNTKLKQLGFQFKYEHFQQGSRETIRWYKDHHWFPAENWGKEETFYARKRNPEPEVK